MSELPHPIIAKATDSFRADAAADNSVNNPDKFRHLGSVGDLHALIKRCRQVRRGMA